MPLTLAVPASEALGYLIDSKHKVLLIAERTVLFPVIRAYYLAALALRGACVAQILPNSIVNTAKVALVLVELILTNLLSLFLFWFIKLIWIIYIEVMPLRSFLNLITFELLQPALRALSCFILSPELWLL